jgi:hypothetical protein
VHVELVAIVVKSFDGLSTEFVCRVEVDAGGNQQVGKVFRGNVTGPRGMVARGTGGFHGDGVVRLGPEM